MIRVRIARGLPLPCAKLEIQEEDQSQRGDDRARELSQ